MVEIIVKVTPIIVLILLGYFMRIKGFLSHETIGDLKKIIVDFALPSVLFLTFYNMELKAEHLWLSVAIFIMCTLLLLVGIGLYELGIVKWRVYPFINTSFSFGLLGIALFGTVFGQDNLNTFAVFGIGHELFIWILFMLTLRVRLNKEQLSPKMIINFVKSPLIIAVTAGILLNVTGATAVLNTMQLTGGVLNTLRYLADITNPLIFLIIGFSLEFDSHYTRLSAKYTLIRYVNVFVIAYLVKFLLIDPFMETGLMFEYAYFTFAALSPPLSLSIFIGKYGTMEEEKVASNMVVFSTMTAIILFMGLTIASTLLT